MRLEPFDHQTLRSSQLPIRAIFHPIHSDSSHTFQPRKDVRNGMRVDRNQEFVNVYHCYPIGFPAKLWQVMIVTPDLPTITGPILKRDKAPSNVWFKDICCVVCAVVIGQPEILNAY
jgi:hypothetical protein